MEKDQPQEKAIGATERKELVDLILKLSVAKPGKDFLQLMQEKEITLKDAWLIGHSAALLAVIRWLLSSQKKSSTALN